MAASLFHNKGRAFVGVADLWRFMLSMVIWLLPSFFLVVFVLLKTPFLREFQFDNDEGINLMKALLFERGFSLYDEIWSDQPPVFTVLLAWWFKIFGDLS